MAISKLKAGFLGAVAMGLASAPMPASALNIVLRPDASFSSSPDGAAALFAFQKAANYWNQTLTNNVTLNFAVSFSDLGDPNIIAQAGSNGLTASVSSIYAGLAANKSTALDNVAVANLRPLSAAGGVAYRMPAAAIASPSNAQLGLNASPTVGSVYDNDDTYNNIFAAPNTANAKVLGLNFDYANTFFGANIDAEITFNSTFAFDLDPTDGIGVGLQDFTSVAIHEMGHALGFVSGADTYDFYAGPNGPGSNSIFGNTFDWDNGAFIPALGGFVTPEVLSVLDLYRYSTSAFTADGKRVLQLDPGRNVGFSVDAVNFFNGNGVFSQFATGQFNGDGSQASHWKDSEGSYDFNGCFTPEVEQIGIMDPTSGSCQQGIVTANDLAAFDAIGYNLGFDVLNNRNYNFDTRQVFGLSGLAAVPEPATWAMMIGGMGFVGGAMRRRRRANVSVNFA